MTQRIRNHYILGLALFGIYGVQVCPFLDSLSLRQLLLPIVCSFALIALLRWQLNGWIANTEIKHQVKRQFAVDLGLYAAVGLALAAYFRLSYQSPLDSGLKIVLGMMILGFLSACHLALSRERRIAEQLAKEGKNIRPDCNPYPLSHKFRWFATLCALAVIGVVFMVISKDLEWLVNVGHDVPLLEAQSYILTEVAFVVTVIMAYVLTIILAYADNLKFFIHTQEQALAAVAQGDLETHVPITSNDEFGLMALHTNETITALKQQNIELGLTRDASILGLASLAEARDNETGGHILRTQHYVKVLAEALSANPQYRSKLDPETIELLYKSAPLHDIGKVGVPDNILLKPGKLTDAEFEVMKDHPKIGADALAIAEKQLGSNSFLRYAREISLSHHEKWDGSGYPAGSKGQDIPLSGRLMALADVYDALISKRVYKEAFSHEKAKSIIIEGSGSHFDPAIVDAFIACEQGFIDIAHHYADAALAAA